jgi:hypothetical protein
VYSQLLTSSGPLTTQPGTRLVQTLVVAGGGGGGTGGGGGGAGGLRFICASVCGATPYSITVGAGGAGASGRGTTGSCFKFWIKFSIWRRWRR